MDKQELKKISKLLSYLLRHNPSAIGLQLDEKGWTDVDTLLKQLNKHGHSIDLVLLEQVIEANDKKRFAFNDDGSKIRASQGHSIEVDLSYQPIIPPDILYHGTAEKNIDSILRDGLLKKERHHVHLSVDMATALEVGRRYGKAVVLQINTAAMQNDGILFYLSDNGVWLTDSVPPVYISIKS